jgi:Na+/melibiose symporter-like transporter
MAAGALLGGITIATGGPLAGLAANLASYAVATYLYSRMHTTTSEPAGAAAKNRSWRDGLRYICTNRPVAVVIAAIATVTLATGLANATLPRFTSNLGLGTGGYGIALAALATGMMIGEALTGAIAEHIHARSLAAGLLAMGVLFAAFAWSRTPTEALLLFAAFGIANGFVEVAMLTAIHHHADTSHHGRVFGVGSTLWRTTTLGAVALAPAINALATPAQTLTVAAACLLIAGASVHVALPRSTGAQPATA